MKKRTWIRRIFCSLLLLVLPLGGCCREPYSLSVHCRYEQRAVAGMELDLYRAGSLDNRGRFVPAEGFGSGSVLPESWDALADTLAELARDPGAPGHPKDGHPGGCPDSPAWRQGPTWQSPGMRKPTIRPSPSWRPFRAKTRRPGQRWRRWRFIPSCKSTSLRLRQPPPRPRFPASHPGCPRRGRTGRVSAYWACLAWALSAGPS